MFGGALLYVFSKSAKFSLFKPAEEMVYIRCGGGATRRRLQKQTQRPGGALRCIAGRASLKNRGHKVGLFRLPPFSLPASPTFPSSPLPSDRLLPANTLRSH